MYKILKKSDPFDEYHFFFYYQKIVLTNSKNEMTSNSLPKLTIHSLSQFRPQLEEDLTQKHMRVITPPSI